MSVKVWVLGGGRSVVRWKDRVKEYMYESVDEEEGLN